MSKLEGVTSRSPALGLADNQEFWKIVVAVFAVDVIWLWSSGMRLTIGYIPAVVFTMLIATYLFYTIVRPNERLAALALMFSQFSALTSVNVVLIYLTATSKFKLTDNYLAAADAAIGFDWLVMFNWVQTHPVIDFILILAYASITMQACAMPVILNMAGRLDRMWEFLWLFSGTLLIISLIAWLLPAESAWVYYGVADLTRAYHLADLTALRTGQMREIVLAKVVGLITFPSFHAALGLILIYVTRGIRILFPISLALNVLMILSTPVEGGHYLVDVLAGLALVPAVILMIQQLRFKVKTFGGPIRAQS
ncbi:phosphatase PAP2 family protein [Bradyrhizobium mercantei]|uniref:phosphatase PAP2 family protein n=1 Tax=Bradyrhizobium mercantei TaxID=1904807 RepID=UPI000975EDB7|nr:phosphatase PAP2 family protein [Bradyrhizobium mercantei]